MEFKKKKLVKGNKNILNIVWIVSIWIIFIIALFIIKNINIIKLSIDEKNLIKLDSEILKNQDNEIKNDKNIQSNKNNKKNDAYLNILLLWRDNAWYLTDTIMLAKLNTEKKYISMLSIPRDLYVKYPWKNSNEWRINSIYPAFSNQNKNPELWINAIKEKVTEITWEKIDHYVSIDFNWFVEIIDAIWWITLEINENFVDYQYPDSNWWYRTLVFRKWIWLFNGTNTLKYVRSRHSTSDFDRSLRQQQVIEAVKNKLSWSFFITSPWKIKELYDIFTKNLQTDISFTKIVSLAYTLNSRNEYKIYSANMNDTCYSASSNCEKWWILYAPLRDLFNWMAVLLINWTYKWNLSDYTISKKYADLSLNNPKIVEENWIINIFNSTRTSNLAWELVYKIKRYGFNIPDVNSIWNTELEYEKSIIYYNNIDENSDTIIWLKKIFPWEFKKIENSLYSKTEAKIEIIIWKDYLIDKSIFKF